MTILKLKKGRNGVTILVIMIISHIFRSFIQL